MKNQLFVNIGLLLVSLVLIIPSQAENPEDLKKIWEHFEKKEHEELANVVHKIKPSITFMGIHELKDLVPRIEDNAKKGKLDALEKQIQQFEKVCRSALKELKEEAFVAN